MRDLIREGSVSMPVFSSAPRAIREGLLFPYLGGADFVRRFVATRPEKELLADLPVSTRQILDDSAYFGSARAVPVTVTLPEPRTGTVVFDNTLGTFETRLMLAQHLRSDERARRAAIGLAGDRFTVIRATPGDALVWVSAWDTAEQAGAFSAAVFEAARRRYGLSANGAPVEGTVRRVEVPAGEGSAGRVVTVQVEQVGGKSVVQYMDLPVGLSAPVDAARISVTSPSGAAPVTAAGR
jgi:hypothetical protein